MIISKVCGGIQTLNHQRMLKILTCLVFGLMSFLPLKPVVSLYRKKAVGFPISTLSTNMVIGSSLAVYAALNLLISNSIYGLGQSNNSSVECRWCGFTGGLTACGSWLVQKRGPWSKVREGSTHPSSIDYNEVWHSVCAYNQAYMLPWMPLYVCEWASTLKSFKLNRAEITKN